MVELGITDWTIWILYVVLFFLILYLYQGSKSNRETYKYFLPGYLLKCLGGAAFVNVYIYYYGFGDTFLYFNGANELASALLNDPVEYFQLLFSENGNLDPHLKRYETLIPYSRTAEEWFMVKLISPLVLFGFKSYLATTFFISLISFFGAWKLYQVFIDFWSDGKKWGFYVVFLIPSILFWSAGILKDAVAFAALNCLIYSSYFVLIKNKRTFGNIILALVAIYLLYNLKNYVLFSFIPAVLVGLYAKIKYSIRSVIVRFLMTPLLLSMILVFGYFVGSSLISANEQFTAQGLEKQAKGFHTWHTTTAGSAYNLGEVEYTFTGALQKVPAALNVTLFRPYLWESTNVVMIASAIESLMLLMLFIYMLFKWKFQLIGVFRRNPILQFFLVFILIFGFAVGFTSYNFGALVRYKIPIYSLCYFILIYLVVIDKEKDKSAN